MLNILYSWLFYAILALFTLIYLYSTRNYSYWSKRGINGPKPLPFVGTLLYQLLTKRSELEIKWHKRYGKIYGTYDGSKPVLRVSEPKLIKEILVKDFHIFPDRQSNPNRHPITDRNLAILEGDDWKRVRSIVSPTFTSGKMKRMYPLIKQCLHDLTHELDSYAVSGEDVNMKTMYGKYTMDVIATCAFGTKVNPYKDPENPFIVNAQRVFAPSVRNILRLLSAVVFPAPIQRLLELSGFGGSSKTRDFFFGIIRRIMNERKSDAKKYNDFIELMMNVETNDKTEGIVRDSNDVIDSHHVNEGEEELEMERKTLSNVEKYMTENEIIAQAFVFLVAGYETTGTTLSHCTQELALNPQIQESLYEEVMSAVDSKGDIEYDVLARLPYLDSVISETLRLHSPAFGLRRKASEEYKLGDTGITLYKGQTIEITQFAIHHSEEYYPNPYHFNPDRFMPEHRSKIIAYTYLPFGSGPRNCIGMRLALLEAKLALAQVVKRYRIVRTKATDVPVRLTRSIILHTPERVIVGLVKRD